ncbi:RNA polymerase sigma factor [Pedobacter endophyticus]|uniref:RNA polymerase sigma-70 factor n=1 Tax=Pedobacter endophyticus TaxID=2789740 RepID=A0A7S9L2V3_9SPHI|nr:RNA polymerase sigma-70 factor [Pedobacter endophyticus]QPH41428.1 RNA polymerase sigma-70 factor [Pedobacter endophyticus]
MNSISSLTDDKLLGLLKTKDHKAFDELYNRYWAVLFLHAGRLLKSDAEAADIVQDLFTGLWLKAATIEIKVSLSLYLYTATRNKVLDRIRQKKTSSDYLASINEFIEKGYVPTDYRIREKELSIIIENELNALPAKMRKVFVLSRKKNLSYSQIATHLKVSEHTVKSQISNALRVLRSKIKPSSYWLFYLINLFN